eukprot:Selendium_serpulae@DN5689_c0_g1_i2.p2
MPLLPTVMEQLLYLYDRLEELFEGALPPVSSWCQLELLHISVKIWRHDRQAVDLLQSLRSSLWMCNEIQTVLDFRQNYFSDALTYSRHVPRRCNDARIDPNTRRLRPLDWTIFRLYKAFSVFGIYTNLAFRYSKSLGLYLVAVTDIPKTTVICEYAGNVEPLRWNLSSMQTSKFDSIYDLLPVGDSRRSLVVVPDPHSNIARFICGVNNKDKASRKRVNVTSSRAIIGGRMHIMMWATSDIPAGSKLYIDYNADKLRAHYPTEDFT